MKIACLQFDATLGQFSHNVRRAEAILEGHNPTDLDLLVLPELAFTGYNFPSLEAIRPHLEPTVAGKTAQWAIETAQRLCCYVIVGYPEISQRILPESVSPEVPSKNYNSTVIVAPDGEVVANYRKSFLYYTDETWASEGPSGSAFHEHTDTAKPFFCGQLGQLGKMGHGICMDINPYRFTADWKAYEFANVMLRENVRLVVLSMAWLTRLLPADLDIRPTAADTETIAYWVERFFPFVEYAPGDEIIVVFANRCGIEGNQTGVTHVENGEPVEEGDRVCYAGSSCIMKFKAGGVSIFDMLGKNEDSLLVVDTTSHAKWQLRQVPQYQPGAPPL